MHNSDIPVILLFGGHDPSGGAGLAADVATCWALGCHAVSVLTAVTVQNTRGVQDYQLVEPKLVVAQARALIEDIPVRACKTGMLGSAVIVDALAPVLDALAPIPLVVDPVLAADQGASLASPDLAAALKSKLIPRATVVTPNLPEARSLTGAQLPAQAAQHLLDTGCQGVLVTGTHDQGTGDIVHRWYRKHAVAESHWPRQPGEYHGSGCTLASAIAAYLGHGLADDEAVERGLRFAWQAVVRGFQPGAGQYIPDRFWQLAPDLRSK